jgi:hypothetical protein
MVRSDRLSTLGGAAGGRNSPRKDRACATTRRMRERMSGVWRYSGAKTGSSNFGAHRLPAGGTAAIGGRSAGQAGKLFGNRRLLLSKANAPNS